MIVSDARREANRRNALKSSGPTSQEGKDRSRENALKHGLTALVVAAEDAEAMQAEAEAAKKAEAEARREDRAEERAEASSKSQNEATPETPAEAIVPPDAVPEPAPDRREARIRQAEGRREAKKRQLDRKRA